MKKFNELIASEKQSIADAIANITIQTNTPHFGLREWNESVESESLQIHEYIQKNFEVDIAYFEIDVYLAKGLFYEHQFAIPDLAHDPETFFRQSLSQTSANLNNRMRKLGIYDTEQELMLNGACDTESITIDPTTKQRSMSVVITVIDLSEVTATDLRENETFLECLQDELSFSRALYHADFEA